MVELEGKSGVRHTFSKAETSSAPKGVSEGDNLVVESVTDIVNSMATIMEVLALFVKALDVGAREVSLEAPSFDEQAKEIAAEYGIRLRKK